MYFRNRMFVLAALAVICLVVPDVSYATDAPPAPPTAEEARAFVDAAEKRLMEIGRAHV